ncbi:MAG: TldD/PmbA family protein, partial [Cyanobacteria bacterium J06641_5]
MSPLATPAPTITNTKLAQQAIAAISAAGCEYGDVRFCHDRKQNLMARDRSLQQLSDRTSAGFGVRVLWQGAWGFAASPHRTPAEVARVVALAVEVAKGSLLTQREPVRLAPVATYRDTYTTPIEVDPFSIPVETKAELLLSLTDGLLTQPGAVKKAYAFLRCSREEKLFASTEGAFIEQTLYRTFPGFGCTAISDGDAQSRSYERPPRNCGYEWVDTVDLQAQVARVAAEANEKVRAPEAPARNDATLIIKPSNLYLTIHESVGHPTELDRVFGYEANFAGTSFATTDGLGCLKYGAPWVNFKADRTQLGGRSTVAYDDEGVPAQDWYVVKDGILSDYLTDRETAHRLGRPSSNGCAFADSWASVPMVRDLNLESAPS